MNEKMVREADKIYSSRSFPNLSFRKGDATELNYEQQFDLVTSSSTLHLIENKRDALHSIKRSLKPSGRVIMQIPVSHGFGGAIEKVTSKERWSKYFANFDSGWHFNSVEDYESMLSEADLQAKRVEVTRIEGNFESRQAFKEHIAGWLPHLQAIPAAEQDAFLEELLTAFAEEYPLDSDGRINYFVDRLEVEAVNPAGEMIPSSDWALEDEVDMDRIEERQ